MSNRQPHLKKIHKFYRWALFMIVCLGLGLDLAWQQNMALARGVGAGAMIAFLMQWVFTALSYRQQRVLGRQMMANMYLGMLARWGVGIVGFVITFVLIRPMPLAVFVGFLLMQAVIVLGLYRLGK